MPRIFFWQSSPPTRGPSNKLAAAFTDLFARRHWRELRSLGAAAWWNTCGVTNLCVRLMGPKVKDLTEACFGRLSVIKRGPAINGETRWWCACSCGRACVLVRSASLLREKTRSCGCLQREKASALSSSRQIHGLRDTPEYGVWCAMRRRCSDETDPFYPSYGGRGIKVCEEWERNFATFIREMGRRPAGCSIERLDNDGGYCASNCVWAEAKRQARNRRSTAWVQCDGRVVSLADAAETAGVPYKKAWKMMKRGERFIRVGAPA